NFALPSPPQQAPSYPPPYSLRFVCKPTVETPQPARRPPESNARSCNAPAVQPKTELQPHNLGAQSADPSPLPARKTLPAPCATPRRSPTYQTRCCTFSVKPSRGPAETSSSP